jgi:hypothetical protein
VAEKRILDVSSVRIVEGCDLASEQPGGEHRDVLARDRQNMCNGSEKDGKLVALHCETGRWCTRGVLKTPAARFALSEEGLIEEEHVQTDDQRDYHRGYPGGQAVVD